MSSNCFKTTPASVDDLVDFIVRSVREHHQRTGRRIDGSFLAHLVRIEYPAIDYAKLGITRLGDAVRIAEARKLLTRHEDVLHLEVSPTSNEEQKRVPVSEGLDRQRFYVRPEFWRAFVLSTGKATFFHRTDGRIAEVSSDQNLELERDHNYVRINSIAETDQRDWARQFLNSRTAVSKSTEEDYRDLVRGVRNRFESAVNRDWKAFRVAKVIDHIKRWANDNGLPTEQILVPARKDAKYRSYAGLRDEAAIRRAVLAAVEEMPLAELEQLAIPMRYVIRHFIAK